jgi:hypothetical protein
MRTAEVVTAALLVAIGAVACYEGGTLGLFGWGAMGPEPGVYPFVLGAGLVLTGLLLLGRALFARPSSTMDRPFLPPRGLRPVLSAGLPAAAMVLLMPFVGLYVASGLYLAAYMHWIGRYRLVVSLLAGILLPLAGYIVFQRWFLIPVPEGSLTARFGF